MTPTPSKPPTHKCPWCGKKVKLYLPEWLPRPDGGNYTIIMHTDRRGETCLGSFRMVGKK